MTALNGARHRRQVFLIALGSCLASALMLTFGMMAFSRFDSAAKAREDYDRTALAIGTSMADLHQQIGFGGFIHNFKNLVLRGDLAGYQPGIERNLAGITTDLDQVDALISTPEDKKAVAQLRATFAEYEAKYRLSIPMILAGKPPTEIDAVVKVSDTAAIAALAQLRSRMAERQKVADQVARGLQASAHSFGGILVFTLVLGAMGTMVVFLRRVVDANDKIQRIADTLRISDSHLRKLSRAVEQSPNMILITNQVGVIEYVNPSFCELTGYSVAEAIGRKPSLLRSEDTPAETYAKLWQTILAGHEWRGELKDRGKDGRTFWSAVVISPVRDDSGETTHFVSMHENITERKLAEESIRHARDQAESASRSKSEILANMSHELRTPLNAVIGYSETLMSEIFGPAPNPKFAEYIKDIHESGLHLLSLINDILDVSAIDAGKIELYEEYLSLCEVVIASVRLMAPRAEAAKLTVINHVPEEFPPLFLDRRRSKQILLNLLSNAVKFTPHGGMITVSAQYAMTGQVEIIVTDTGIGMDQAGITKALTLFGQVDSGLTRSQEGSGLGLPLTQRLVELHGGVLTIASEKGVGTQVTVTFPAERVAPSLARVVSCG